MFVLIIKYRVILLIYINLGAVKMTRDSVVDGTDTTDTINSIDLAVDVRSLLANNTDVKCKDVSIKNTIHIAKPDDLIHIKKVIGSFTTIVYAKIVDDDCLVDII